jgi:protein-disulfide isomerase
MLGRSMSLMTGLALSLVFSTLTFAQTPSPAPAPSVSPLPEAQRAMMEATIKSYLMANPEIIEEALQELDKRKQVSQKDAKDKALQTEKDALLNASHSAVIGNAKGDTTLVEFFDYNCGYCKKAALELDQLIKADPKLRLVLKDFPVLGPDSVEAHEVALAVKNQLEGEKYWAFHLKGMSLKGTVTKERMIEVAKNSSVNMERLTADLKGGELRKFLGHNVDLGDKLGLTGTPSYVIGSEIVYGAVGLQTLTKTIAGVRQCGKATC